MSKIGSALFVLAVVGAVGTSSAQAGGPRSSIKDDAYGGINWSGFYVGIQGGYAWGDTEHTTDGLGGGTSGEFRANGGLIGITTGTNWQTGNWVYGFESDFSFSDIDAGPKGGTGFLTDIRNLGTARLRLGYAANTSLVYVTGGLAYADVRTGVTNVLFSLDEDETRYGWALGAGIEWAFAPRWSLKAEYLHIDLGDRQAYALPFFGDIDVRLTADIARIGVNYNLGPDLWGTVLGAR